MKCIINGQVILENQIVQKNVFIEDNIIIEISDRKPVDEEIIDAEGLYVSPGFIDVHTHGRMGKDTMDGNFESLDIMSQAHLKTGVTSFLATTVTNPVDLTYQAVKNVYDNKDKVNGSKVLGVHLEGPFICSLYKGAQPEESIIAPTFDNYNKMVGEYSSIIKKITLAPELENADLLIKKLAADGVSVSLGHSNANYEEAVKAFKLGANSTTHTYNAMTPLKHRNGGIVGAVMNTKEAYAELIVDGKHVEWPACKVLLKMKDRDKIVFVSDTLEAAGMPAGEYQLGGQKVFVRNGRMELEDGTIAGSIISMNKEVLNAVKYLDVSLATAVSYASRNPALSIHEDKLGLIEEGFIADIILFDDQINVKHAIVNGKYKF